MVAAHTHDGQSRLNKQSENIASCLRPWFFRRICLGECPSFHHFVWFRGVASVDVVYIVVIAAAFCSSVCSSWTHAHVTPPSQPPPHQPPKAKTNTIMPASAAAWRLRTAPSAPKELLSLAWKIHTRLHKVVIFPDPPTGHLIDFSTEPGYLPNKMHTIRKLRIRAFE